MAKRTIFIIFGVVSIIVVGFAGWWFYNKSSSGEFDKSAKGLQVGAVINSEGASKTLSSSGGNVELDM